MSDFDPTLDETPARRFDPVLIRRLTGFLRPYRWNAIGLFSLVALVALFEAMLPQLMRLVIDRVIVGGNHGELGLYAAAYGVLVLVMALCIWCFIVLGGKVSSHVSHDIRRAGFAHLQRLSFSFFDHRPVGWLMARMTSDCERLANILAWGFLDLCWGATMMLGIALAMLVMNPKLALIVLAIMPALAWVSAKFQRRILSSARRVRATNSRITASYNEAIMGVLTSKAFVREDANQRDFRGLTGAMYGASVLNQTQAAIYVPIVITLASLATGLALAFGGVDLLYGSITAGTLVAFMAYARHFFDPVEELGHWFAEMQMAQASAERILSLIETVPEIRDSEAVRQAMARRKVLAPSDRQAEDGGSRRIDRIELKNLSFAYDPQKPVLRDINLTVERGQTIAIVGPTGGGKSTLVNLICRFYEPTGGQVLFDGVDYRERSLHWLQSNLGMVLQNAHVFTGSIRENIRYGRLDATDAEVEEAARIAGAHDFICQFPAGYDTEAGEGGTRLSAGQKQLVSFARAILADPQLLVMDEATSSVDTETEQKIQLGLQALLAGRIAFVIAHRLSTIRSADRIVVIEDGIITEQGTHGELMARRGHYFELYRQQSLHEVSRDVGLLPAGA